MALLALAETVCQGARTAPVLVCSCAKGLATGYRIAQQSLTALLPSWRSVASPVVELPPTLLPSVSASAVTTQSRHAPAPRAGEPREAADTARLPELSDKYSAIDAALATAEEAVYMRRLLLVD